MTKTIILGIGNPILGDDGVGIHILQRLKNTLRGDYVFEEASTSGLQLAEKIMGYDKAILIDSFKTKNGKIGDIHRLTIENMPKLYGSSPHDLDFLTAVKFMKQNTSMPREIKIYGIEAGEINTYQTEISEPVQEAADKLIKELTEVLA